MPVACSMFLYVNALLSVVCMCVRSLYVSLCTGVFSCVRH